MTKRKKPTASKPWDLEYLPYFTELCLIHGWPHRDWLPSDWGRDQSAASKQATANRDAQVARGNLGTIVGLSERSDARLLAVPNAPGQMVGDARAMSNVRTQPAPTAAQEQR